MSFKQSRGQLRSLVVVLACLAAASAVAQDQAPERPSGWTDKRPVESRRFMVAAANPLAVEAGYKILRAGGSAVDATIAVQLVLGLTEPQSSGLGGGAFLLAHDGRTHKLIAYDGRETAPAAATPERFVGNDGKPLDFMDAVIGGRAVGVPGTVRLLEIVHRKHGRLPWSTLFAPAIALAENGFAVSPRLFMLVASEKNLQGRAKAYFLDEGRPRAIDTIVKNPAYAATLRHLAKEGANAFYTGEIAQDIVDTVRGHPTNPGDITRAVMFMLGRDLSGASFPESGFTGGWHGTSHHGDKPENVANYAKINRYHAQLFSQYLTKLRATPDGDGSLLDHMTILYGSGISNSTKHSGDNLPLLVVGGGAGRLKSGRHLKYTGNPPMANLLVTLLDKLDAPVERLGGSTGKLPLETLSGV